MNTKTIRVANIEQATYLLMSDTRRNFPTVDYYIKIIQGVVVINLGLPTTNLKTARNRFEKIVNVFSK